jgi:hypothetical protein
VVDTCMQTEWRFLIGGHNYMNKGLNLILIRVNPNFYVHIYIYIYIKKKKYSKLEAGLAVTLQPPGSVPSGR